MIELMGISAQEATARMLEFARAWRRYIQAESMLYAFEHMTEEVEA